MTEQLLKGAGRFEFFQAVRLIQQGSSKHPVGRDQLPKEEALRFRAAPFLGFPSSSVVELRRRPPGASRGPELEMEVAFLGLAGPAGVLPHHYTRLLNERIRQGDHALRDFLDLFNHRLISLFYRAWEKCNFPAAYELAWREREQDLFTNCLYSLIGFGTGGLRGRLDFNDEVLLRYAGLFADRHRPAICLQEMLADHFGIPVAIEQLRGQWLPLSPEDQSALPDGNSIPGRCHELGVDLVLGDSVWDLQGMFRIKLGPVSYPQFRHWIPTGDALRPLSQLVRTFAGLEFQFDVQVVLKGREVPSFHLPETDDNKPMAEDYEPLLGWTTWLPTEGTTSNEPDVEDAVFILDDV